MWQPDEAALEAGRKPFDVVPSPAAPIQPPKPRPADERPPDRAVPNAVANIGKSVVVKGELHASEDLVVDGQVEGKVEVRDHVLTVGSNGQIRADVYARAVVVCGDVTGNIVASEKIDIREKGSVEGDIKGPRVIIADGAHFRGSVDMQRSPKAEARPELRPVAAPPAGPVPVSARPRVES